ncbi:MULTISPECIES: hypothetical protein [Deinococcus]|jgi:hypothetical protein|uniref:hypothetical protein n=1 Tax=Deinococcus TaxID=1298 RepID=UPI0006DC00B3|nr:MULTISPECIES: hypothetical protein [Deinococcus]PIG95960.1 hypothetical protein AMD26_018910 [Deinococcus sp. UR1]
MSEPAVLPVLLVIVPPDWEADPAALAELRRCLADDYGARLSLRQGAVPMRSPLPLFCGVWPRGLIWYARRDVVPRVQQAFFTLNWLDLDDAAV